MATVGRAYATLRNAAEPGVIWHMNKPKAIKSILMFLAFLTPSISAEELTVPYTVVRSCPFEGCTYGMWEVKKETPVYKEPNLNSNILGTLEVGTKANVETGISFITPGEAKITGEPYKTAKDLNRNQNIYILNYIGEGYSRVYQDGRIITTKIARTKSECIQNPNWRYCWVNLLSEPIDHWWVKIKSSGWVPMKDFPLEPIDVLSIHMPYNKRLKWIALSSRRSLLATT